MFALFSPFEDVAGKAPNGSVGGGGGKEGMAGLCFVWQINQYE